MRNRADLAGKQAQMTYYNYGEYAEVAYWRKCWNVRHAIMNAIAGGIEDNGETSICLEDVYAIIAALETFTEENWDDDSWAYGSIWEWEEYKDHHANNIARLKLLALLMEDEPDLEVYFYDSY